MEHEKPEITKDIIEFGEAVFVSTLLNDAMNQEDIVKQMLDMQCNNVKYALDYITDMEYIGDVEYVDGTADMLGRLVTKGYRFKAASNGYKVLERHFKCKEKHEPRELTLEYISDVIERYAEQQKYAEDDE